MLKVQIGAFPSSSHLGHSRLKCRADLYLELHVYDCIRFEMKCYSFSHVGEKKTSPRKSKNQTSVLEANFAVEIFPQKNLLKEIALQTGLDERQVSSWFSHKRYRTKVVKGDKDYLILRIHDHNGKV